MPLVHIVRAEMIKNLFLYVSDVLCLRAVEPNGSIRWTLEVGERTNLIRRVLISNVQALSADRATSVNEWIAKTLTSKRLSEATSGSSAYLSFEIPDQPVAQASASTDAGGPSTSRSVKGLPGALAHSGPGEVVFYTVW